MSQYSKTQYKALYGSTGTVFPDNTTEEISEGDMRQFGEDQADSFMSINDNAYNMFVATASGTDTYTATLNPAIASYSSDHRYFIKFTNANTGAATLNLNTLGAKSIVKNGSTALSSGDIAAGQILILAYDGTNLQVIGSSGSSGITNSAANNELMKSNGTNAVASGIFSSAAGDLQLGSSSIANDRNITVAGSSSNVTLNLSSKGTGQIRFIFTSNACLLVQNPSGTAVTLQQLNPGVFTVVGYDGITGNSGGDVLLRSGNGHTNGNGGTLYLSPGAKAGSGADGNIGLLASSGSFGSGQKVIFIANATTVPSSNPTGGGILYVESGALKYRGSSGTVTTIANA